MTALLWPARGPRTDTELEIKKSRFLGFCARVEDEQAAREFIDDVRREFPDARHHCSAYVVWQADAVAVSHSSDDGEPSGTAGRPMLDVLTGAGVTNVCAVVVRYFGGTLLGTGGLVRAYSDAVAATVDKLPLVRVQPATVWELTLPYARAGRAEAELRDRAENYEITAVDHRADGQVLQFATTDVGPLARIVAEVTKGAGRLIDSGTTLLESPA